MRAHVLTTIALEAYAQVLLVCVCAHACVCVTQGVNLPAHFMLGVEGLGVLVDAYAGEVLLVEDAANKLASLMQRPVILDDDVVLVSAAYIHTRACMHAR